MNVRCLWCGNDEGNVTVDANTGDLFCRACETTATADEAEEILGEWRTLLGWVRLHPALKPECREVKAAG